MLIVAGMFFLKLVKSFINWLSRKSKSCGDLGRYNLCSCPLTGDPTSSTYAYECVVNGIVAMTMNRAPGIVASILHVCFPSSPEVVPSNRVTSGTGG